MLVLKEGRRTYMSSRFTTIDRSSRSFRRSATSAGFVQPVVLTGVLTLLLAGAAFADSKKIISPPGTKPGGNYSQGILVDDVLYVAGQAGEDSAGQISKDFEAEVTQALENIGAVLKAAGMSPSDVVSTQVYLTDVTLFQRMNAVYTKYFKDPRPTRTTVIVSSLAGAGHIEITVTARK